jgi:hypothetical protein
MTDIENLEIQIKYLERELKEARWTYLDSMAQAALASGRYAANQCYDIAQRTLEARNAHNVSRPALPGQG